MVIFSLFFGSFSFLGDFFNFFLVQRTRKVSYCKNIFFFGHHKNMFVWLLDAKLRVPKFEGGIFLSFEGGLISSENVIIVGSLCTESKKRRFSISMTIIHNFRVVLDLFVRSQIEISLFLSFQSITTVFFRGGFH